MSKKRFGRLLSAAMCVLMAAASCLTVFAAGMTVTIRECDNLQVTLPDNMTAVTRSSNADDPYYALHNLNYTDVQQSFLDGDIYMQAMDDGNVVTLTLSYLETDAKDFGALSNEELSEVARRFVASINSEVQYNSSTQDETAVDTPWIFFNISVSDPEGKVSRQYQATTVQNGKNITLTLYRNGGDVEYSDYAVLESVARTVNIPVKPFYLNRWFWLIAGGTVVAIILIIMLIIIIRGAKRRNKQTKNDKILEELAGKYKTRQGSQLSYGDDAVDISKSAAQSSAAAKPAVPEVTAQKAEAKKSVPAQTETKVSGATKNGAAKSAPVSKGFYGDDEPKRKYSDEDIARLLGDLEDDENFDDTLPVTEADFEDDSEVWDSVEEKAERISEEPVEDDPENEPFAADVAEDTAESANSPEEDAPSGKEPEEEQEFDDIFSDKSLLPSDGEQPEEAYADDNSEEAYGGSAQGEAGAEDGSAEAHADEPAPERAFEDDFVGAEDGTDMNDYVSNNGESGEDGQEENYDVYGSDDAYAGEPNEEAEDEIDINEFEPPDDAYDEDFYEGVSDEEEIYDDEPSVNDVGTVIKYADDISGDDDEFDDLTSIDTFLANRSNDAVRRDEPDDESDLPEPTDAPELYTISGAGADEAETDEADEEYYDDIDDIDDIDDLDTDEDFYEGTDGIESVDDIDSDEGDTDEAHYDETDGGTDEALTAEAATIIALPGGEDPVETDRDDEETDEMNDGVSSIKEVYADENGSKVKSALKRGFMSAFPFGDSGDEDFEEYLNDEVLAREESRQEKFRDSKDFFEEAPRRFSGAVSHKDAEYAEYEDDPDEDESEEKESVAAEPTYPLKSMANAAKKLGGRAKTFGKHCGYFAVNVKRSVKSSRVKKKRHKADEERRRRELERRRQAQVMQERRRASNGLIKVHSRGDGKYPQAKPQHSAPNNKNNADPRG